MTKMLEIHHDPASCRFSAEVDGHGLELDYVRHGEQLIFSHTGTAPELQGRGLAGKLVEHGLRWVAPLGLQLVPQCSYVVTWLQRQPRWQRLQLVPAVQQVLNYWFDPIGGAQDLQARSQWFSKNDAVDEEIRQRFGHLIQAALAGGLDDWVTQPLGRLARILLLDQFTRNAFRGQAQAFAGDALALADALALLDSGQDQALEPLQRWFLLMPLEHAEDLAMQQRSVTEFERLAVIEPKLADALAYAKRHLEVIARFGRFPHRNAALQRSSSAEELAYLNQPGSGF